MRVRSVGTLSFALLLTSFTFSQSSSQSASSQSSQPGAVPPASGAGAETSKKAHQTAGASSPQKAAEKVSESAKPGDKSHDYSQEAFVIEQMHSRYRFETDGTGRKEVIARIRVQSEAGVQQWGQIPVGYNSANERVEIPYVRVLKEDGSVIKAGDDAVQDLSAPVEREAPVYTDYRQKHITVPGLRPGEVLEYDMVTVIHTPLATGEFWTDYDFEKNSIMLDETVDVDIPASRNVKLKCKSGMDPKITEENGRRIYHWSNTHLVREDEKDKDKAGPKQDTVRVLEQKIVAGFNATVLEAVAKPDSGGLTLLRDAAEAMRLSARGYHRVLRVARTLADLDGADKVGRVHLAEALSYRALADEVRRAA